MSSANKVLNVYFYIELVVQRGIKLSPNEINILTLFVKNKKKSEVIALAMENDYAMSEQTIDNAISKMGKLNILIKGSRGERTINRDYFDSEVTDLLILNLIIHNKQMNLLALSKPSFYRM